jgi:hypothetical protein
MTKNRGRKRSYGRGNILAKIIAPALGIVGVLLLYGVPVTILTCRFVESSQVDCRLKQRALGFIPVGEISIPHLQQAYVSWDTQTRRRESDNREVDYSVSKVILVTPSGETALNDYVDPAITVGNSERIAGRINDYLAGPPTAETLTVWQAIWLPLLVGGCFSTFLLLWLVGLAIEFGRSLKRRGRGAKVGMRP